jgi:hypothetical protein
MLTSQKHCLKISSLQFRETLKANPSSKVLLRGHWSTDPNLGICLFVKTVYLRYCNMMSKNHKRMILKSFIYRRNVHYYATKSVLQ